MFRFIPRQIPDKIYVIGCGGTGSRLIPLLVQFLRSITKEHNPRGWLEKVQICLIDFDEVEHKNLLRQNFIEVDVGKPKATVMAQRYGRAYNMPIVSILKRIDPNMSESGLFVDTPLQDLQMPFANSIVIMCVDSAEARRSILNMVGRSSEYIPENVCPFIIDAGNEDHFGQVRFFHHKHIVNNNGSWEDISYPKQVPTVLDINWLPYDPGFYAGLQDAPAARSCADLDQTLAINAIMATTIMGVVQNFYYVKPMTYNEVSVSLDGSSYTTFNTFSNFKSKVVRSTAGYRGRHTPDTILQDWLEAARADEAEMKRKLDEAMKAAELAAKEKDKPEAVPKLEPVKPAPKRPRKAKAEPEVIENAPEPRAEYVLSSEEGTVSGPLADVLRELGATSGWVQTASAVAAQAADINILREIERMAVDDRSF